MEWQVFCFSILHLGSFYFKLFGDYAISTPNNIRSKRHLWQKGIIVQIRSGYIWFRSTAWVDLRISDGARHIRFVWVAVFQAKIKNLEVTVKMIQENAVDLKAIIANLTETLDEFKRKPFGTSSVSIRKITQKNLFVKKHLSRNIN